MAQETVRRRSAAWIVIALALALVGLGGWLAVTHQPPGGVRALTRDGLQVRIDHWEWVHHDMEVDNGGFKMPAAMMPGMPAEGHERLHIELTVRNVGSAPRHFDVNQLAAFTNDGKTSGVTEAEFEAIDLGPGQAITGSLSFDVPESAKSVALHWREGAEGQALLRTGMPVHEIPAAQVIWPTLVSALPPGNSESGVKLYQTKACASCHGHPQLPRSNLVGPHLGGIASVAESRVSGKSAEQYLYESMTDPGAFVAPLCARDEPCPSPSTMPSYRNTLSLQEAADLLAYLRAQTVRTSGSRP